MLAELATSDKRPQPADDLLWIWIVKPPIGASSAGQVVGELAAGRVDVPNVERTIMVDRPGRQLTAARSMRLWLLGAAVLLVGAGAAVAEVDSRVSAWHHEAATTGARAAEKEAQPQGGAYLPDSFVFGAGQSCLPCVCPCEAAGPKVKRRGSPRGARRSGWSRRKRNRRVRAAVEWHIRRARHAVRIGRWQPARLHAARAVRLAPRNKRARRLLRLARRRGRS
jgi:hypothetical protein